jgi:hypothetical protein
VRVHRDSDAASLTRAVGARAFTTGADIFFGSGQYDPDSQAGYGVLAHEVTHTGQPDTGVHPIGALDVSDPADPDERAASAAADMAVRNRGRHGEVPAGEPPSQGGATRIRRWPWDTRRSSREALEHALGPDGESSDLHDVTDFSGTSDGEKVRLIQLALNQIWVGGYDEAALERLWGSLPGPRFAAFATDHLDLWDQCIYRGANLTDLPQYAQLGDDFRADVRNTAKQYLGVNQAVITAERDRLGIPAGPAGATPPTPTAQQEEEMRQLQSAANTMAQLQRAQELARNSYVGWRIGDGGEVEGESVGRRVKFQVKFDPAQPPPLREEPADVPYGFPLLYRQVDYDALHTEYEKAVAAITLLTALYPAAYTLARTGDSAGTASFAREADPARARARMGTALTSLEADMARAATQLNDTGFDALDLTPIVDQLFEGRAPLGGNRWTTGLPQRVARSVVVGHNIDRVLVRLLLQKAQELAFLFAPFTGGLTLVALLGAGAAAAGANLVISARDYEAISAMQGVSPTPGTELTTDAAVNNARQLVEADAIAFGLAALALGTAIAGAVAGRPGAPPPGGPGGTPGGGGPRPPMQPGVYTLLATDAEGAVLTSDQMVSQPFRTHPNRAGIQNQLTSLGVELVEDATLVGQRGASADVGYIRVLGQDGQTITRARLRVSPEATAHDVFHEMNHLGDFRSGRMDPTRTVQAANAEEFAHLRTAPFEELMRAPAVPSAALTEADRFKFVARRSVEEIRNHLRDIDEFAPGTGGRAAADPEMQWFRERQLETMESTYVRSIRRLMTDAQLAEHRQVIADYVRNLVQTTWPELPGEFARISGGNRSFWTATGVPPP